MFMKNISFTIILIALLAFWGCTETGSTGNSGGAASGTLNKTEVVKEITDAEAALYNVDNFTFDPVRANAVVMAYSKFAQGFPEDKQSAEYLFKSGEIYRSLKQYPKAIEAYNTINDKYGSYAKAAQSLFLTGFCYENDLKDFPKAKAAYESFLTKYPDHELAKDVRFSMENLGRSPEDIIKEFEKRNKK